MKKMICVECGTKDSFEMKEVTRKYEGDGYYFEMQVCVPFCKKCGAPITNEEIEEEIAKQANAKIREMRGIISKEKILTILDQYHVSQKFLSKLLGWGEITLTRYISGGYTPNLTNSNKLKGLSNPYIFLALLNNWIEQQEYDVGEDASFRKAQKSVWNELDQLEKTSGGMYKVVNWFLAQSSEEDQITHLALQKLLYFTQGWSRILIGDWMVEDTCEAWVHGAVYSSVYDEFKNFKYMPLPKVSKPIDFSNDQLRLMKMIKDYYFDVYSAKTLEAICHKEQPYILTRKGIQKDVNSKELIPKKSIERYYKEIAEKYQVTLEDTSGIRRYLNDLLY